MKKGKTTGAKALVKELQEAGVSVVFGYPGGATLPIHDEIQSSTLRFVLSRHEQGAAHMADGYCRATGKTGVCMATSGPGATNLVTGIATAYMDSSSVVAITGQVPRPMIGNDAFQEVDITGITVPITKHNYLVQNPRDLPHIIKEAFYLSSTGRKGPVLVDIPKDVQTESFSSADIRYPDLEGYNPTIDGHPGQIKKALQLLEKAERPVLLVGGGCCSSGAETSLRDLAERSDLPVVSTLMGKAAFPNTQGDYLGMIGYHGRVAANRALMEADVIIAAGVRFGDRSTGNLKNFAPQASMIHLDIDPAEISKNVPAFLPIVGDVNNILTAMAAQVKPTKRKAWLSALHTAKNQHPLRVPEPFSIPGILRQVREMVDPAILVTDVGRHQIFAAHYWDTDIPKSFITSGGLGTMGFGLPASLGAKTGRPDMPVILITGDGSFLMCCQEIAAAAAAGISVIVLIMNDSGLGMIRQLQDTFYGGRRAESSFPGRVNFAGLAESLGAVGITALTPEEIAEGVKQGLKNPVPTIIDCILEKQDHTYPMVTGDSLLHYVE
ncbi:MAG: biosynthetic-type acetolactate synthase large subunit [Spirochaetales bacterium]|nr:biosynthetic-type acetolactate synthase large subunit [Spirochaetales bacterium]